MITNTIKDLIGQTMSDCTTDNRSYLKFHFQNGKVFQFFHEQEDSELVIIESIEGNLSDLVGTPIRMAEEATKQKGVGGGEGSDTWTFYKFATIKGFVNVRWHGESNGYYSEKVDYKFIS